MVFQKPEMLAVLLSFPKSLHLEESMLCDRGNHAVGELVCAVKFELAIAFDQKIVSKKTAQSIRLRG